MHCREVASESGFATTTVPDTIPPPMWHALLIDVQAVFSAMGDAGAEVEDPLGVFDGADATSEV